VSAHGAAGPSAGGIRPARRDESPAIARGQPDLRVIEPREDRAGGRRRRIRFALFGAGSFVAVVVFGLVGVHVVLAQNQFRLDRLNTTAAGEEARYQRLRLQVDRLEAPQRIVATAEGRLGMVPPAGVIYLTPSPPVTSPSPAAGGAPVEGGPTSAPASSTPSTTIPAVGDWAAVKPQLVARP
jgi:hypothetical protein